MQDMKDTTTLAGQTAEEIELVKDVAEDEKNTAPGTVMDKFVQKVAENISSVKTTRIDVWAHVVNSFKTIATMNAETEFSVGLKIGDQLYRFNEYEGLSIFTEFVDAAAIKVADKDSAIDVKDRKAWSMNMGKVLTPEEFKLSSKTIAKALRLREPEYTTVSRSSVLLLAQAAEIALVGGKVKSRSQSNFTFTTVKLYDKDYYECQLSELAGKLVNGLAG